MDVLLHELQLVSSDVPRGAHERVAEIMGMHKNYLYQIRRGQNMTLDTPENRERMRDIISEYRGQIRLEIETLQEKL